MPNDIGYNSSKAIPNKALNSDGSITDLLGNAVSDPILEYELAKALPNKFLNADGSYSTLQDILIAGIDTGIFIVVEELPSVGVTNKIYLVPNGHNTFDEYFWDGENWDKIGETYIDLSNYYTKTETDNNFLKKTNTTEYTPTANYHPATKKYVDDAISTNITNMLGGNY